MFHFFTGHIFDSLMAPPKRKEHAQGRYRESSPNSTPFCWPSSHNEIIWDSKFCLRRDERSTLTPFPYEPVLYSKLKSMQLSQAAAQNTRAVYIKRIALSIVQQWVKTFYTIKPCVWDRTEFHLPIHSRFSMSHGSSALCQQHFILTSSQVCKLSM